MLMLNSICVEMAPVVACESLVPLLHSMKEGQMVIAVTHDEATKQ